MSKHTPGPWYEARDYGQQALVVNATTGEYVAVAFDKLDANFIAAAVNKYLGCVSQKQKVSKWPQKP